MTIADIQAAKITLDEQGVPYSEAFGDCYFSRQDGLAETRYVFLQGNDLPQRWQHQAQHVIAETGFGTGLNFLATWQAWQQDPLRCGHLHYISIEKYPITKQQLAVLLKRWLELRGYADALIEQYPPVISGFHRLHFANDCITLTLCFTDVDTALNSLSAQVDSWYLDGFAPSRNADMWQLSVIQAMVRLSRSNTQLATFTAASQVRHHLQAAGFSPRKRKGFGKKREMLTAILAQPVISSTMLPAQAPWFQRSQAIFTEKTACVIGAGIAGCQMAYALARRGWQVKVIERHAQIAQQASGNKAGIVSPKMTAQSTQGELFYSQSFLYAQQQLRSLCRDHEIEWQACGAMQLNHNQREQQRWHALQRRQLAQDFVQLLNVQQASEKAGVELPYAASYFPQGGSLNPASLCAALLAHDNIELLNNTDVLQLQQLASGDWQVLMLNGSVLMQSPVVVIANGKDMAQFTHSAHLPHQWVRGQTTLAKSTRESEAIRCALGHEGYFTPAMAGMHVFGASYERDERVPLLQESVDQQNYTVLARYLPTLGHSLGKLKSGHAALRCSTPDRYPYMGVLPDVTFYQQAYADIAHGRHYQHYPAAQSHTGLFMLAGLASRGLTSAALCAEALASDMSHEPSPLPHSLLQALHPARYLIRQLQRGEGR